MCLTRVSDLQNCRSLCEEALLKIKGVISFTFQMAVKRCIVRIRSDLKAEVSFVAVASLRWFWAGSGLVLLCLSMTWTLCVFRLWLPPSPPHK